MQVAALLRTEANSVAPLPPAKPAKITAISVRLAQTLRERQAAQKLRYTVFAGEYGAQLFTPVPGLDIDAFDAQCDHLIALQGDQVIGCYRMLPLTTPERLANSYLSEEFFVTRLGKLLPQLVEFGRTCIHPAHRNSSVLLALWSGLAGYMQARGLRYGVGCASVSLRDGGANARATWQALGQQQGINALTEVFPINRLAIDRMQSTPSGGAVPPLITGYAKLNAQLIGAPAWDPDFGSSDFPLLLDLQTIPKKYAKHFGLGEINRSN